MGRRLVIASIGLIAVGLALIVVSDPSLRVIGGSGGFAPGASQFSGNFTARGNFTPGQFRTLRSAGGFGGLTPIESLLGIGLVGAGLLLEVFSIFISTRPPKPVS